MTVKMLVRGVAIVACAVAAAASGGEPGAESHLYAQAAAARAPIPNAAVIADLRPAIARLMEEHKIPGIAVAVVTDRQTLWTEGFGFTDVDRKTPVTPSTLFSIQSMSKNFTAVAVLTAARDGLVDLDVPITTYLPDFTVQSRFEEHPERKMTLRLLLSHRAGFTHEAPVGNNFVPGKWDEHLRSIPRTWLRFPVNERYSYSNLGIDLAAWIVQVRSRMPFAEYVRKRVLEPVGMKATTFEVQRILAETTRAIGHSGAPTPPPVEVPMVGAGGCYASASELARWVRWHLDGGAIDGKRLIPASLYREMTRMQSPEPRQTQGYGLGLGIARSRGRILLNHGGGGFGFLTYMGWYPEWKIGVIVLTNSSNHPIQQSLPLRIFDAFLDARLGALPAEPAAAIDPALVPVNLTPERLVPFAGRYLMGPSGPVPVRLKDGRLEMGDEAKPEVFTFSSAEGDAWTVHNGAPVYYRFVRGAARRPPRLIRLADGAIVDLDAGPSDPPGPDQPEWDRYIGTYRLEAYGAPAGTVRVAKVSGYLCLNTMRLAEHEPGLFFSVTGEAADFRTQPPTWRNVELKRVAEQPEKKVP